MEFKKVALFEEAFNTYMEHMKVWEQNPKVVFSDSLIDQMTKQMNIPKEKVLGILNRSIK